jgi:hypothetical protein
MLPIMALVTWLVAAVLGLTLLRIWVQGGGGQPGRSHVRVSVMLGHSGGAVAAVALLVAYLLVDRPDRLAWTTVAVTLTTSLLGAVMYIPWWWRRRRGLQARASRTAELVAAGGSPLPRPASPSAGPSDVLPVERRYPNRIVLAHGLVADLTLALVVLVALNLG